MGVVEAVDDADAGLPTPRLVTTATRPLTAAELVATEDGGIVDLPVVRPIVGNDPGVTYG